jgi:hypothetical protein
MIRPKKGWMMGRRILTLVGAAVLGLPLFGAAPAALADVYTGSIQFSPPSPPPPSFQPQPDPTTQYEYLQTATTTYDQAAGSVTVAVTVDNNAYWSNPYGQGPELFARDFYLAPACADSSNQVPYGAAYITFNYGAGAPDEYGNFYAQPGSQQGSLTLDGVQGSLTAESAFDGATYSITFQDPTLIGHRWNCSGVYPVSPDSVANGYASFDLHGPPKPPPAPAAQHCKAPSPSARRGPRDDREVAFGNVVARGMSCPAALTAIRTGHLNPRFHTRGFSCTVVKQTRVGPPGHGGLILGQRIRCARDSRQFQWSWST